MPQRQMYKVRYDEKGEQVAFPPDGEEPEQSKYFDVKLTKRAWYKRGSGPAYQDTTYTFCKKPADRQYEDDLTIKVTDESDNELSSITYKKRIRRQTVISGTGPAYQKTRLRYCNLDDGVDSSDPREVRVQKLMSGAGHVDVERIKKFTVNSGTGPTQQKKRIAHLCNEEEQLTDKSNTELLDPDGSTRPET